MIQTKIIKNWGMYICSYCYEKIQYPVVMDCKHIICTVCLLKLRK